MFYQKQALHSKFLSISLIWPISSYLPRFKGILSLRFHVKVDSGDSFGGDVVGRGGGTSSPANSVLHWSKVLDRKVSFPSEFELNLENEYLSFIQVICFESCKTMLLVDMKFF